MPPADSFAQTRYRSCFYWTTRPFMSSANSLLNGTLRHEELLRRGRTLGLETVSCLHAALPSVTPSC